MTQLSRWSSSCNKNMCTHKRYVTNRYTGKRLLVPCGHCPACLQAKANHMAQRIKNAVKDDEITLFCTLTYDEKFIPYVKRSDLENNELLSVPIYRDYTTRYFKGSIIVKPCRVPIGSIDCFDSESGEIFKDRLSFVPNLWKKGRGFHQDKMGVILYSDIQNFFKRVRTNFARNYGYNLFIKSFQCSEYGETKYRPHFHINVVCRKEDVDRVRDTIVRSWSYANLAEFRRSIEIARNASSYVASYVNSSTSIPETLALLSKPQHSCSKFFGVDQPFFSLPKILEKADKRSLSYSRATKINGIPTVLDVPIPKYVINRYFPLFKGLCGLSPDSLDILLRFPYIGFRYHKFENITNYIDKTLEHETFKKYEVVDKLETKSDTWSNYIRLSHCIDYYIKVTGKTRYDYAIDYQRVWNCYKSTIYKMMFEDVSVSPFELYDNIEDFWNGYVRNDSLERLAYGKINLTCNFNDFKQTKKISDYYSELYFKKVKHKKTNSYIYSRTNNNF